jgi:hypothetical protein
MEDIFSLEKNPDLPMEELEASLAEFRKDYNQTHFVRNDTFKAAADKIQGPTRKIFVEFLERSCTAGEVGRGGWAPRGLRRPTSTAPDANLLLPLALQHYLCVPVAVRTS